MSAHTRRLQGRPGTVALLAIAFAFASILGSAALAPTSAFAAEQTAGPEVEVCEGVTLVTSVDDDGVLRVEQVVVEGTATYSAAEGEAAAEIIALSPDDAADVIDLQSEEVLVALAAAYNGWYEANTGDWYYFVNGKWATGWKKIDGDWFCFKDNGIMRTGWYSDGTYWFYLRPSYGDPTSGVKGSMVTGWASIDGYWYYFDTNDGDMKHGWRYLGGNWYYFRTLNNDPCSGPEGAMVVDWAKISGVWYYFDADGSLHTGRLFYGGYEYYMTDEALGVSSDGAGYGAMHTRFLQIGPDWFYYFDLSDHGMFMGGPEPPEGALVKNRTFEKLLGPKDVFVEGRIDGIGRVIYNIYVPASRADVLGQNS